MQIFYEINGRNLSEIVRLLMSMQVDRINQQKVVWNGNYKNPNSREYQTLEGESNYAVSVYIYEKAALLCGHISLCYCNTLPRLAIKLIYG